MMMMKLKLHLAALLLPLSLLLPPSPATAQDFAKATFNGQYDLDSATLTFCVTTGSNGSAWGAPILGPKPIKTTGSSTTVVAVTAGDAPFASVAVGDNLFVARPDGTTDFRIVATKTDADNITITVAVNWDQTGGFAFSFLKVTCGTTGADGWISVGELDDVKLVVQYDQGDLGTGLDVRWECRDSSLNTQPTTVYPGDSADCGGGTLAGGFCNYATAGQAARTAALPAVPWEACRIGIKAATTDPSDAGANIELITAYVTGRRAAK